MLTRPEKIRLGIFLTFGFTVVFGFFVFFAGKNLLRSSDSYIIVFTATSLSGLDNGAPVKYQGLKIGSVKDISIDPEDISKIITTIEVKEGTPIRQNARAIVEVFGITGLKFINIVGGTNRAKLLEPGSNINPGISVIAKVTGKADVIIEKLELSLNQLLALTGEEMRGKLNRTLEASAKMAENLNYILRDNRRSIKLMTDSLPRQTGFLMGRATKVLSRLDSTIAGLNKMINGPHIGKSFKNLEIVTAEMQKAIGGNRLKNVLTNTSKTLVSTQRAVDNISSTISVHNEKLDDILTKLERTVNNLADFTQKIKDNPSLLIRKSSEDE